MSTGCGKHSCRDALYLDIPYIIDSVCRHADYAINRLHDFKVGTPPLSRAYARLPAFLLFVLILWFCAYGPTFSALCGVVGADAMRVLRCGIGGGIVVAAALQLRVSFVYMLARVERRFRKLKITERWGRRLLVQSVLTVVLVVFALPLFFIGTALLTDAGLDRCTANTQRGPAFVQLGLWLLAIGAGVVATRRCRTTASRVILQAVILVSMVALLWTLPGVRVRTEAAQVPYPHLYSVLAAALALIAALTPLLILMPFGSMKPSDGDEFRQNLSRRELFPRSRDDPELSPRRIFGGGVIGVVQKPLQALLLPAFAILLVPSGYIWTACLGGAFAAAMLLTAANLTSRWEQMSQYLRRYFLLGTPLVVSFGVIVVAALRLADVQYVTTILNVAPFGVLFVWMVMTYVLTWWFEYQINSVLATKLLWVLGARTESDVELIGCDLDTSCQASRVERKERYLAAHAIGEFVVLGVMTERETDEKIAVFDARAFLDLFATLRDETQGDQNAELGRRVQLYFALVNLLLVSIVGLLYWHLERGDRINSVTPVVTADAGPPSSSVDLAALLESTPAHSQPAIIVAASGGGTRAALYAAAVLHGLHDLKVDQNVILLSGVSGGGVAAAYFYSHRDALLGGIEQPCGTPGQRMDPWDCYQERMAMPFIRDVLEGAGEWRIQSDAPLGILLAESFDRRLFFDGRQTLGADPAIGLILNTSISGHPVEDATLLTNGVIRPPPIVEQACQQFERPVAALAGGRLAFANLRNIAAFDKSSTEVPNMQLPFKVVRDPTVRLADAAALNANFPPVFPNARVDLMRSADITACKIRSYFVTDGGATENLGLISALFALQSALEDSELHAPLRDIDIVLSEASAFALDYAQDRGVGAATDESKERLTGRLTLELLDQVRELARGVDPHMEIRLHDLSLPRLFRSRGGFGTHWMFPASITVTNPHVMPLPRDWIRRLLGIVGVKRYDVSLEERELLDLWRDLFPKRGDFCARSSDSVNPRVVVGWICGENIDGFGTFAADPQLRAWAELRADLSSGWD
jgi:hypothetical protein